MTDSDDRNHSTQVWTTHMAAIASSSQMAINAAVLANGAAAAAVLALLGSVWDKPAAVRILPPAIDALTGFGLGAFLALIAAASAYFSHFGYLLTDRSRAGRYQKVTFLFGRTFHVLAVLGIAGGIVCFGFGAWHGILALSHVTFQ